MEIKFLTGAFDSLRGRFAPKEFRFFMALAIVILSAAYFNIFLKPKFSQVSEFKRQEQQSKDRLQSTVSKFPDIKKSRKELEGLKKEIEDIKLESAGIEGELISASQVPQLVTSVIKCAQGLNIDFQSVIQKAEVDKEGFSKVYIDAKFNSGYEDTVNYLHKIETISPFIKMESIEVAQSKSSPSSLVSVFLRLSTILSQEENTEARAPLSAEKEAVKRLKVGRSPFASKYIAAKGKKKLLKISGITFRGQGTLSTAIINNKIVRIGEEIDGQKIERILPDSVVVNDGGESYTVALEK